MLSSLLPTDVQPSLTAAGTIARFLDDQHSPATRRAYAADLRSFFGGEPESDAVAAFLAQARSRLARRLRSYKAELLAQGVSEATVNRRLSTVRSLLNFAHARGLAVCCGRGLVEGEKVPPPAERAHMSTPALKRLLAAPGTRTLRGRRDTAILYLLGENALRRAELCALNASDFSAEERQLLLLDRGRDVPKQVVPLSRKAAEAIEAYLDMAGHAADPTAPLFRNLDHRPGIRGGRLTADGVYLVVREYGLLVGADRLTPQQLRRSAIAMAVEESGSVLQRVLRPFHGPDDLCQAVRPHSPPAEQTVPAPSPAFPPAAPAAGTPAEATPGRWRRVLRLSRHKETVYFAVREPGATN